MTGNLDPVFRGLEVSVVRESSINQIKDKGKAARLGARELAKIPRSIKDEALMNIAKALKSREAEILSANQEDVRYGRDAGLDDAMIDRLMLDPSRLAGIAEDVKQVANLPDPIGETFDARTMPNGLEVSRRRVPLGVIAAIYESRPNVTIDIATLCIKSGNAVMLRGGSEAIRSNTVLSELVRDCVALAGISGEIVQFVESTDRALVEIMLSMKEYIDLVIPRGGAELIQFVSDTAAMPVITGGIGVCHTYVDSEADLEQAVAIAHNAKVQRPTVCNALDTLLIHAEIAQSCLPSIARQWADAGVEMHCDNRAFDLLTPLGIPNVKPSKDDDWGREFLSLTAAVKVVDSLDEALEHIERYGSGHSEAIITENHSKAMKFLDDVDAAAVLVNASTRFTDGSQLGLGAEVAISTNKMHARGPMGLRELTSYKWIVLGNGQTRT